VVRSSIRLKPRVSDMKTLAGSKTHPAI